MFNLPAFVGIDHDALVGSAFFLKGNFAKAEGLVIRYGMEYDSCEHLGEMVEGKL